MNGKKIFCLSLIILSVAMGLHWFKHRPKVTKKKRIRPRTAINVDDLQLIDTKAVKGAKPAQPNSDKVASGEVALNNGAAGDTKNPDGQNASETATASETEDIENASDSTGLNADPIIFAFNHMKRNPYECSPYVKLVEKIQKEEKKLAEETGKGKETKLLSAVFSATIKTDDDLVAVIDSRLYRKGDEF